MPIVNRNAMRLALREMHRLSRQPRLWLVLAAISLLIGLVGPFETFEHPLGPRLVYWTVIVVTTGALGTLITLLTLALLPQHWPHTAVAALGGLLAGAPIGCLVWFINHLAYGPQDDGMSLGALVAYCIPIAGLVTAVGHVLGAAIVPQPAAAPLAHPGPPAPPLLDRLPLPQRGRLLHLAVNDHYVDVTTDKGTTLVLIRLSDAIRETAPVPGLQVHRSHWIALDAVRRAARRSGKPVLELENGREVPVSRSFLAATRAAGLL